MFRSYRPDFIVFVYLFSLKLFQSAFKAVSLVYGLYILELGVERDSFSKARLDEKGRHNSRDETGHFRGAFSVTFALNLKQQLAGNMQKHAIYGMLSCKKLIILFLV